MKPSQFNVIGVEQDRAWIFNSWTETLMWVPSRFGTCLKSGPLHMLPATAVASMVKAGMIVPDALDEVERLRQRVKRNRASQPLRVVVIPTYQCNLQCPYCYAQDAVTPAPLERPPVDWPEQIAEFVRMRAPLSKQRTVTVAFIGGEPLVEAALCSEILERCARTLEEIGKKVYATVTTNGSILNGEAMRLLRRAGHLHVTLDGIKEEHDKYRFGSDGGTYTTVLNFIRTGAEYGADQTIRFHLRPEYTAEYLAECARELFRAVGHLPRISVYFANVAPGCYALSLQCPEGEAATAGADLRAEAKKAFVAAGWPEQQVHLVLDGDEQLLVKRNCGLVAENTFVLDVCNDLYACPLALKNRRTRLGRLGTSGPEFTALRHALVEFEPLRRCRTCDVMPFCEGGCLVKAAVKHGRLDRPFCDKRNIRNSIREYALQVRRNGT